MKDLRLASQKFGFAFKGLQSEGSNTTSSIASVSGPRNPQEAAPFSFVLMTGPRPLSKYDGGHYACRNMALICTSGDPMELLRFPNDDLVHSWARLLQRRELLSGRILVGWPSVAFNNDSLSFLSKSLWRAGELSPEGPRVCSLLEIRTLSGVATRSGLNGRLL